MSSGEIAGLIAACAFVLLVVIVAIPLIKLGRVLGETTVLVSSVTEQTVPLLSEVTTSVTHVNAELERVDAITENVQQISSNVSALTSVVAVTLGGPLVKVAAFSYGVRRAVNRRRARDEIGQARRQRRRAG